MADEENIIRDRLTVEERTLRRVTRKHATFISFLEQGNLKEACVLNVVIAYEIPYSKPWKFNRRQNYNEFLVDFSTYELSLIRFQIIHDMNLREAQHWEKESQRIGAEIEETKSIIERLEKELEEAEEIRKNKVEYDLLASEINEHQTRDESKEEIATLDEEISQLEEKERVINEIMERRKSQLERIVSVLREIHSEIQADQEQHKYIFGESEAPNTTPESIRSESASPVGSPIPPPPEIIPQANGINGTDKDIPNENGISDDSTNGVERAATPRSNGDSPDTIRMNIDDNLPLDRETTDMSLNDDVVDGSQIIDEEISRENRNEEGAIVDENEETESVVGDVGEVAEGENNNAYAADEEVLGIEDMDDVIASEENDEYPCPLSAEEENDEIPLVDEGEIVEDVDDTDDDSVNRKRRRDVNEDDVEDESFDRKRKCEVDDEDDEEGVISDKNPRSYDPEGEDDGEIRSSDEGAIENEDDDTETIEDVDTVRVMLKFISIPVVTCQPLKFSFSIV
ncbi:6232_t:CDS:2 [Acaulospora colombiana]|uniref:6232_t:CDS:1 n=1 Tax=Acaulospora colombiana TaxID=27376 RepID=A0ACA9JUV6_9GLOM|nr:6232_t:CDS:2 [Acaulospora colombiana]